MPSAYLHCSIQARRGDKEGKRHLAIRAIRSLVIFALLCSIIGTLALTAPEYVACRDLCPDEFLDLALASQDSVLPVFDLHRNTHPTLLRSLKTLYFQEIPFLTTCLRC